MPPSPASGSSPSSDGPASDKPLSPAPALGHGASAPAPALGPEPDPIEQTCECQICRQPKHRSEVFPADLVRPGVAAVIRKEHPHFTAEGCICLDDLNRYRSRYAREMLQTPGRLASLRKSVVDEMGAEETGVKSDAENEFEQTLTFGERLADRIAAIGGSWSFLIFFGVVLVVWMTLNSLNWFGKPWDPYPFILLNLVLSCLAAVQAPIIMMSQNRQEDRDRVHAEHDYRVNLKAELEIRHLHAKIDLLMTEQWRRLLEVQQTQLDLITAAKEKLEQAERGGRAAGRGAPETGERASDDSE
ncbi:MAG TPA: DUF1003 domain-containing protein [Pirellulales bacterium]